MYSRLIAFLVLISNGLLFAEGGAQPAARGQNPMQIFLIVGIGLLFFYMILWRPEKKRRKKLEEQQRSLAKGVRVTAMGILGTVEKVNETSVVLKMVDGSKIEMLKRAISEVDVAASGSATPSGEG